MDNCVQLILAGYYFFSGQMGLTMFATANDIDGAAWICYVGALGLMVSLVYLAIIRQRIDA